MTSHNSVIFLCLTSNVDMCGKQTAARTIISTNFSLKCDSFSGLGLFWYWFGVVVKIYELVTERLQDWTRTPMCLNCVYHKVINKIITIIVVLLVLILKIFQFLYYCHYRLWVLIFIWVGIHHDSICFTAFNSCRLFCIKMAVLHQYFKVLH